MLPRPALPRTPLRALALLLPVLFLPALLSLGPDARAQTPTLVIENARVFVGDGRVLEGASVVVAGNRVLSVSERRVRIPEVRRIDASGMTVLPGLIDTHVHLTIGPGVEDEVSLAAFVGQQVPGILEGFLRHGVTTVRSTGDYWPAVGELRDRLATGETSGPRLLVAGPVLTAEGAHPAPTICRGNPFCREHVVEEVASPEEAREAVRRLAEEGVDFVKLVSDSLLAPVQISEAVVAATVAESHRQGLDAVGHVAEAGFVRREVETGLDGLVHPYFRPRSAETARSVADLLVQEGVPVSSTLSIPLVYARLAGVEAPLDAAFEEGTDLHRRLVESARSVASMAEAGVQVALGTDWCACTVEPGSEAHPSIRPGAVTHTEMQILGWGGMAPEAVLRAATADAARAIGLGHVLGTLEPGKLADMVIVDGNPLADLSAVEEVEVVVQNGEVVFEAGDGE